MLTIVTEAEFHHQVIDKYAVLKNYIDKGIIPSLGIFTTDEYHARIDDVKIVFGEYKNKLTTN